MSPDLISAVKQALQQDDVPAIAKFLKQNPNARAHVDDGLFDWGMPALAAARSPEMVDLLIENGASVAKVGDWWAAGFGASRVKPETAEHLIELGAAVSPHAAAGLGLADRLRQMLDADPELVRAKGGDGCHPLHFATTVEVARLLVERGADPDARDDDHRSTPAQWRIDDAPKVARFLLGRGASPDIFMAAAFGDLELAQQLIADDPDCTTFRIGHNNGAFPGIGFGGRGGTIYQWTLGFNLSPHEVALKRGHRAAYDLLMTHTAPRHQLLVACTLADRKLAESIAAQHPEIVDAQLDEDDRALLAKFCWETNIDTEAVRLMLDLGFPIDVPETNHGYMALHNAAWCGNPVLVKLLLDRGHPVGRRDPSYDATALGYAIHSCTEAKRHPDGKFPEVVELLLAAGTPFDEKFYPVGDAGIDAVLKRYLEK